MSDTFDQPSVNRAIFQPVRPVDGMTVAILRAVDDALAALAIPFFVAGATSRDLILTHLFGIHTGRATRDIDFGIAIESWDQLDALVASLTGSGLFVPDGKMRQRLHWRGGPAEVPVDILPFGGVADASQQLAWPPGRDIVLNVAGFEEAFRASISVQIADGLTVRVSSLPGLTVLKLLAWNDRRGRTDKDAVDLAKILAAYSRAGADARIYEAEIELLEDCDYDIDLAAAHLLGRDAAAICGDPTGGLLRAILESDSLLDALLRQMKGTAADAGRLRRLRTGFLESLPPK